jgi:DNA-binding NtrC family response regulator
MAARADVWNSIFTCNLRRYLRSLYHRMRRLNTLIVGPSGTGKELVARAIGLSQYVPFDAPSGRFAVNFADSFHAINLSALSPTLIESELFGHKKGAFTGAARDYQGWLGACGSHGSVFLDEIGELEIPLQVKLLRLLETRTFHRVGDTQTVPFLGKFIAATHRDLPLEIARGRFRQDLYYRLCGDMIVTPSLYEQLAECPEDLHELVLFIARQVVGEEADVLAEEVEQWTATNLGRDYPWPGNIRELEQCVRNILVRRDYRPLRLPATASGATLPERLAAVFQQGWPTIGELVDEYIRVVYQRTGSYEEAAKMLGCNWRTVKSRIDRAHVRDDSLGGAAFQPHRAAASRPARCADRSKRGPVP